MKSQEEFIKVNGLKKYYTVSKDRKGKHFLRAVDDISLTIKRSEILGVVGESGSGKSTLGRCILNLIPVDEGEVIYQGERIDNKNRRKFMPYRKKMQMVFQNPLSSFDAKQYIGSSFKELCKVYHIPYESMNQKLINILDMINLSADTLNRMPNQLSGGQLQRLAIARALLLEPEFLVADEPVSALDVSVQAQILNLIMDLRDEMGLTMLFISHDLNVVEKVCDTIAVLYLGTIVEIAPKKKLFQNMAHPYTQGLVSAKPKEHPSEQKNRILLRGEIPSAIDIPAGCRFAGRCKYFVEGKCNKENPPLISIEPGHFVACHFPINY